MHHYLITFSITIDGQKTIYGKLGVSIPQADEELAIRKVKEDALARCKKAYPKAKQLIVVVRNIEAVDKDELGTSPGFQP
jgi:hypothetical protein